jgi:hypothetical protein
MTSIRESPASSEAFGSAGQTTAAICLCTMPPTMSTNSTAK